MALSKAVSAASLLLFANAFAGRFDEVARGRGFHPDALKALEKRGLGVGGEAAKKRRYCNDGKADYFVESLPEVPQSFMTEMYSGLIPTNMDEPDERALFFVFQPRVGPPVYEVTIWMNGGPGCSSLEAFLQKNGLVQWTWGQYAPTINQYS